MTPSYPVLFCPRHGAQEGRTVCRFCSFNLFKTPPPGLAPGLPRNIGATSFADPQQVSGQKLADGLEHG
jgi:hypothetical protein